MAAWPPINEPTDGLGAVSIEVTTDAEQTPEDAEAIQAREADQKILEEALRRWQLSYEAESQLRAEMAKDRKFVAGNQWPDQIKAERDEDGRPCLVVNRVAGFVSQVVNRARQTRPSIQIGPVDSGSDVETASILQGIVRHIETQSVAEKAYSHATKDQVEVGRGWWQITAEWADDDSFTQDLRIKRVRNYASIYPDPACQEQDYSDARFAIECTDLPRDEFETEYGEVSGSLAGFVPSNEVQATWVTRDRVRVAKYWRVVTEKVMVALGGDGKPVPVEALGQGLSLQGIRTRAIERRKVEWYLLTGTAIIDRGEWPGKWIPLVPVLGEEVDLNGRVDLRGIVRPARDPQTRYNVQVSAETESIGLAPKAPFVGYKGQFKDPKWAQANRRNYAYLESELLDVNGERVPLPQRQVYEPPIRAIAEAIRQADSDLRSVTGYYDQFPQEEAGSERSGRAILARQRQGELGNSHFVDNLALSIAFTGKLLIDLIPHYYDSGRIMRIVGKDQKPQTVMVYAGAENAPDMIPPDVEKVKDLSAGRYDVTVKMGKSYATTREERADALTALAQAAPQLVPQFADLWIGSQDWDGAQQISRRLQPPDVASQEGGDEPIPPQVQRQMQELSAQHEELTNQLNQAKELLATKRLELESRERVAQMQTQAQVAIAIAQVQSSEGIAALKAQLQQISDELKYDHERQLAREERAEGALDAELDRRHDEALADHAARAKQNAAILAAIASAPPSAPAQGAPAQPPTQPTTTPAPASTPQGVPPGA